MSDIFEPRQNIKPYEYPEVIPYTKAIHETFWTVDEFNFSGDVKEFKVELNDSEREVIKRCMLAISDVENTVKYFWADIGHRLPKPEISNVGHTYGANEVIHQMAYSELLSKLGLEESFGELDQLECIQGRRKYLKRYLDGVKSRSNREFTKSLILFTLLVENVSLFTQFLIISSFYRNKNLLLNISKVIQASAREEQVHGLFGSHLVNIIRRENPEWFDQDMEDKVRRNVRKAYKAECEILDWIFEKGEMDFLTKIETKEYLKKRFNYSLELINYDTEFEVDESLLVNTKYFSNLIDITSDFDFFTARSADYSKGHNYDIDDLF